MTARGELWRVDFGPYEHMFDTMEDMELEQGSMDLAGWPDERLEAEICRRAADMAAAQAGWFGLIAEFDRRSTWATWGCKSAAQWLSWQCGLSALTGREHLRVARRLEEFPATRELFAAGKVSYSKVRALTRVLTPANEATLLGYAQAGSASQLERIVRGYRQVRETNDDPGDVEDKRTVWWRWDDDGMLSFGGRADTDEGAAFLTALGIAHDALYPVAAPSAGPNRVPAETPDTGAQPEPPVDEPPASAADATPDEPAAPVPAGTPLAGGGTRWADAMGVLVDTMLAAGPTPVEGRGDVLIQVDLGLLAAGDNDPSGRYAARIAEGPGLDTHLIERILCDCNVQAVVTGADGNPLNLGRSRNQVNRHQRRALKLRDGGCCWPGCDQRRFVDGHHLVWWSRGGHTDLENLALFCRRHHRFIHHDDIRITRQGDGTLRFLRQDGTELTATDTGDCTSDERTPLDPSGGDLAASDARPFDLHMAVGSLLWDDGALVSS